VKRQRIAGLRRQAAVLWLARRRGVQACGGSIVHGGNVVSMTGSSKICCLMLILAMNYRLLQDLLVGLLL
jgi:hypothetical protein